ncbi:MAG TPA: glycosyltransferase [Chthoniobacteraceae bacterium]|nr:glycosyltransferase [Chthoniobacteraceae bacterium]
MSVPAASPSSTRKRVLLVEPVFFIHTGIHIKAAIGSAGYENAEFTLLIGVYSPETRASALAFEALYPNLTVRLVEEKPEDRGPMTLHWRANVNTLRRVEELLRETQVDLLVYLHADFVFLLFALPWSRRRLPGHFRTRVSGIAFRNNGWCRVAPTLRKRLRGALERAIFRRAIASRFFRRITFLDPLSGAAAAKRFGPVCAPAIEPIDIEPVAPATARQALGIAEGAYVGLIFGGLSRRKGVAEILSIFETADLDTARITLVIAGPVHADIREELMALIERVKKRYTVCFHDGFVPDEAMPLYLSSADCALCTYRNFDGSSGVLLQTASLGIPAMVCEGGVMADAVRRFGFGEVVRLQDPAGYIAAFRRLMNLTPPEQREIAARARAYAATMDASRYLSQFETPFTQPASGKANPDAFPSLTC